jgi:hypothetical protein
VGKFVKTSMKDGKVVVEVLDTNGNPASRINGTPFTSLISSMRSANRAGSLQGRR